MALLLLFLLCYLETACAQNISVNPMTYEVFEGGIITLTCEVTNYKDSYHLQWNRIDGNLTDKQRTTETLTAEGKLILTIMHAQIQDAGTYFCIFYDRVEKIVKISLGSVVTVLFQSLQEYPLCAFSQYLLELKVGTPVLLRCQYPARDFHDNNNTMLVWEKRDQEKVDGTQWRDYDENRKVIYSYLNFTAKEDLHDELFTCTYHNKSVRSEDQICHIGPIGVHFAPKVKVYPETITVEVGEQSTYFNCSGPAQPSNVIYIWNIIPQTELIKTNTINGGATLIITEISTELSGSNFEVKCAAINDVGATNVKSDLHIKSTESKTPLTEEEESSTTLIFFPVAIAVAIVCFLFLLIFIICFLASKSKIENNVNTNVELSAPPENLSTAQIPPVQENSYVELDDAGMVVNLPTDTEQDGAHGIKPGEFVKDDVKLIVN